MSAPAIAAVGLCTPLGLDAETTALEMDAGTLRFVETETPLAEDQPARACRLPLLDPRLSRAERITALAAEAIAPVAALAREARVERIALFLALPEAGSGGELHRDALAAAIRAAAGERPQLDLAGAWPGGRAAPFQALAAAAAALFTPGASRPDAALVCAADSLCDPASLGHLVRAKRVLGPDNSDGLLPGEGAAALLLLRPDRARGLGLRPLGALLACALAAEPTPFDSPEPGLSSGLARAFRELRQDPASGSRRADVILSAQTGESYWAKELGRAYLRNAALMPEPMAVRLAADSFGDLGAAAGAVLIGAALHRASRASPEEALPRRLLAYGSSDRGQVGACLVEAGAGEERR